MKSAIFGGHSPPYDKEQIRGQIFEFDIFLMMSVNYNTRLTTIKIPEIKN
jgi:hypothetical protein